MIEMPGHVAFFAGPTLPCWLGTLYYEESRQLS